MTMQNTTAIRLLDCTLRDGGHITNGFFGEKIIKYVIQKLVEARTDIIEVGFLWDSCCGKDSARFLTIEDVRRVLPKDCGCSRISLMADYIDLSNLEEYDGTVEYIRLSFKRSRKEWAWETLRTLKKKGYKCFINPVNCNVYSDEEYLEVIKTVNELQPYGFSIVDTFGVMRLEDLSSKYYLVENNLDKDIVISVHLHENLGLAYSLAQHFIRIHFPKRQIVIDGSLLGMGRVPGNLCIEQIMEHLNDSYGYDYVLSAAYDAIDDCIAPIKKENPWGYTIAYALSAQNKLHRTYAEFLLNKWKLKTSDIQKILCKIDRSEAELFNEGYIENLYRDYLNVDCDDRIDKEALRQELAYEDILIVAPSDLISHVKEDVLEYRKRGCRLIAINFIPDFCQPDYVFYTNIKRMETEICDIPAPVKVIVTSNLLRYTKEFDYMVHYGSLAYHGGVYCEDSTLMLIHLLDSFGIKKISVAGFDGFARNRRNLYSGIMERDEKGEYKNKEVKRILEEMYGDTHLEYLTDSAYKDKEEAGGSR